MKENDHPKHSPTMDALYWFMLALRERPVLQRHGVTLTRRAKNVQLRQRLLTTERSGGGRYLVL